MAVALCQTDLTHIVYRTLEADIGPFLVVVKGTAADSAALPAAADANFIGVTMENGLSGERRPIAVAGGIVKCTAQAAITEGAWVSIQGVTGKIKAAAPSAGSNSYVLGKAMQAAAADGDIIGVLLCPAILQG